MIIDWNNNYQGAQSNTVFVYTALYVAPVAGMLTMIKLGDNLGVIISPAADKGRTVFIL